MQTYRERRAFVPRVVIGSKYQGPPLDRDPLRTLPRGWYLDVEQPKPLLLQGGVWVGISIVLAWVFAIVETALYWLS